MRLPVILVAAALCALSVRADAQETLLPEDVAASAARHYPEIVDALAGREAAAGELVASRGAFDTVFSVEGRSRAAGFYDGDVVEAKAERAFGPYGARAYGSYRVSDGSFPIYENEAFTNQGGEFKLGVLFSLLRDRTIDERRFGVRDASLALQEAELDLILTRIGVQRRALLSYYEWVEAGQELAVFEDLLALAATRQTALERQVASGARAAIFLTENAQNVTRRRVLVERAQRDLTLAANALSLYYRGEGGAPIVPTADALPIAVPLPPPVGETDVPGILAERPDLALLNTGLARARNRIALAENALKPRLDLGVEVGRDVGPVGEGGPTFDEGELIAGVQFEMPLANRAARGRRAAASAELKALRARQRLAQDRITAELRDVLVTLEAAERLVGLARVEVEQAEAMREAEARRFASGASDFFLVNLREQALADARINLALAILTLNAARTTYDAAVIDEERLGLTVTP